MKNIVILGAGTAGTMMASHLNKKLKKSDWKITIVDQYKTHYYQPGFLFLPLKLFWFFSRVDFHPQSLQKIF